MGLGGYPGVTLLKARENSQSARELIASGIAPIKHRKENITKTFGQVADALIQKLEQDWKKETGRNAWLKKNQQQWNRSLVHYCSRIRSTPIRDIDTQDILQVLKPIWTAKYETARKTRARIERVFDYAAAHGWHNGENPALWKRHLKDILPQRDIKAVKHFEAMPYENIPKFIKTIQAKATLPAMALEFTILTAARTGETLGATWPEIDFEKSMWTIPPYRMKSKQEHKVPLTGHLTTLLANLKETATSDYIFAGNRPDRPLSNMSMAMIMKRMQETATVHGFRSSFRDWCGDKTNVSREVAEAALAHKVGNSVEQAYRRRDALEKRRSLMKNWETYCLGEPINKVVKLHG